jgi:hypothetical protein
MQDLFRRAGKRRTHGAGREHALLVLVQELDTSQVTTRLFGPYFIVTSYVLYPLI